MCVDDHEPILVNNLPVIAWGYQEWTDSALNKRIHWYDNKVKIDN